MAIYLKNEKELGNCFFKYIAKKNKPKWRWCNSKK